MAPGATTTFQVRFMPSVAGTRAATASIANDDPANNSYDFAIQGSATRYTFLPIILKPAR